MVTVKVDDDDLWERIQAGEYDAMTVNWDPREKPMGQTKKPPTSPRPMPAPVGERFRMRKGGVNPLPPPDAKPPPPPPPQRRAKTWQDDMDELMVGVRTPTFNCDCGVIHEVDNRDRLECVCGVQYSKLPSGQWGAIGRTDPYGTPLFHSAVTEIAAASAAAQHNVDYLKHSKPDSPGHMVSCGCGKMYPAGAEHPSHQCKCGASLIRLTTGAYMCERSPSMDTESAERLRQFIKESTTYNRLKVVKVSGPGSDLSVKLHVNVDGGGWEEAELNDSPEAVVERLRQVGSSAESSVEVSRERADPDDIHCDCGEVTHCDAGTSGLTCQCGQRWIRRGGFTDVPWRKAKNGPFTGPVESRMKNGKDVLDGFIFAHNPDWGHGRTKQDARRAIAAALGPRVSPDSFRVLRTFSPEVGTVHGFKYSKPGRWSSAVAVSRQLLEALRDGDVDGDAKHGVMCFPATYIVRSERSVAPKQRRIGSPERATPSRHQSRLAARTAISVSP
jgi:hypothetical protein